MGVITELSMQRNKSRANVYIDGEYVCGLEISVILKHGLKVGVNIENEKRVNC